ncbi:hypothetical protein B481_1351 [Planococcus halocryophilus Or1]|nr:hypothetical protein B481_1351 [Planococcus halocryophilus Or1]
MADCGAMISFVHGAKPNKHPAQADCLFVLFSTALWRPTS